MAPPVIGATIGATAVITIRSEKNLESSLPVNTSRTMARDSTIPAEAVNPCKKRASTNVAILGDSAQNSEDSANSEIEINKGFRLPFASLTGPITSWPMVRPIKQAVKLSCTSDAPAPRSSAISGKLGKYISILRGPSMASIPSRKANANLSFPTGL